jgi:hypothetical protein
MMMMMMMMTMTTMIMIMWKEFMSVRTVTEDSDAVQSSLSGTLWL